MRIAFVTSHPVPYHVPMFRELAARPGVELDVFFTLTFGLAPSFDPGFGRTVKFDVPLLEGYKSHFPKNYSKHPGFGFMKQLHPVLVKTALSGEFDALITHGYQSASTVCTLLTSQIPHRKTRILLRGESNLQLPRSFGKRVAKQVALRALFSKIDHFLAIGTLSREYFEAYGVPRAKISIAPYSVDNAYFAEKSADAQRDPSAVRRKLGLPVDTPLFLYCSKLLPHKRPFDVLHAFAKARKNVRCALAFVGDGECAGALATEVEKLGLGEDVFQLGFRNQSELPEIYGACDVFVQASVREPWGMVVNEAMACGMAICASDQVGSAYDLVKDNGAMFPVGDVDRLSSLIATWAKDPNEIQRMKRASLARIREWGINETVDGVLSGVNAAIASAGKASGHGHHHAVL